jgi:hypothetical protein
MKDPDATEEVVLHVVVAKEKICVIPTRELEEGKYPEQTIPSFPAGGCATARNLTLLTSRRRFGRIDAGRKLEHGGPDVMTIVYVVKCWPSE